MSYFQPNGMLYVDQVSDWREAVDLVTRPLLDAGTIERAMSMPLRHRLPVQEEHI